MATTIALRRAQAIPAVPPLPPRSGIRLTSTPELGLGEDDTELAYVPGARLGRYELLHPIGSGGMGQVWAAEQLGDLGFRKLVALKTVLPALAHDAALRSMLLDEARLASRIRHANVVEVLDLGVHGSSVVFQAMTFVDGVSLSGWAIHAPSRRVPYRAGIRIVIDMLRGLHAAHELCDDDGVPLGLVHRDVSPHNVLVGTDGVAKLTDFGIAKSFGRVAEETSHGDVKGKLGYVAPELLDGMPASPQSDVFSAGVILWEVLTGRRLFELRGPATVELRKSLVVRHPCDVAPDVSERIAEIAMRALDGNPFARFASAREMADALEQVVREENLDFTHQQVAASLEADLGPLLRAHHESIRSERRRGRGRPGAVPPSHHQCPPAAPAVAIEHVHAAPADDVLDPTLLDTPEESPSFAELHATVLGSAIMCALAVLVVIGGIVLHRSNAPLERSPGRAAHVTATTRTPGAHVQRPPAEIAAPSSFVLSR